MEETDWRIQRHAQRVRELIPANPAACDMRALYFLRQLTQSLNRRCKRENKMTQLGRDDIALYNAISRSGFTWRQHIPTDGATVALSPIAQEVSR